MQRAEFPRGDEAAAILWLRDESNHNFDLLSRAVADKPRDWLDLEGTIEAVTGTHIRNVTGLVKGCVERIVGAKDSHKRVTDVERRAIAAEAVVAVLRYIDTKWKSESESWIEAAISAYIPRAISLWKKGLNVAKTKRRQELQATPPLPQDSSAPTSTRRESESVPIAAPKTRHATAQQETPSKRLKVSSTSYTTSTRPVPILLVDRAIRVKRRGGEGRTGTIMAEAIISDAAVKQAMVDIRPEHLDLQKFCQLVQDLDLDPPMREDEVLYADVEGRARNACEADIFAACFAEQQFSLEFSAPENAILFWIERSDFIS